MPHVGGEVFSGHDAEDVRVAPLAVTAALPRGPEQALRSGSCGCSGQQAQLCVQTIRLLLLASESKKNAVED